MNLQLQDTLHETTPALVPPADVYEDEHAVVAELALPGWREDQITVKVEQDTLIVSGRREMSTSFDEKSYWRREIRIGEFSRKLSLPTSIEAEKISHTLKDGLLIVTLPKIGVLPPPHPITK